MFRLDDDRVVDATMTGGVARYINHCCDPNCVTETVELADWHIIIFANRRISRGEELSYDYKVQLKVIIPCFNKLISSLTMKMTTRFRAFAELKTARNG